MDVPENPCAPSPHNTVAIAALKLGSYTLSYGANGFCLVPEQHPGSGVTAYATG